MATVTIRNLPDKTREAIRVKAALNRRSMEAELRDLIERRTPNTPRTWRRLGGSSAFRWATAPALALPCAWAAPP